MYALPRLTAAVSVRRPFYNSLAIRVHEDVGQAPKSDFPKEFTAVRSDDDFPASGS